MLPVGTVVHDKGHYAGIECQFIQQPQTKRGQAAWALANTTRYSPRPYDKNYFIERSKSQAPAKVPPAKDSATIYRTPNGRLRKNNGKLVKFSDPSQANAAAELDDDEDQADQ